MSGDSRVPEVIEFHVVATSGSTFVVQAQGSWKVWELRDGIRRATQIPSYEQHLILGNITLSGKDGLSMLFSSTDDLPLTFTLVRSRVPDGMPRHLASLLWRGFLTFGEDCGDTLDGARTASLLRFAGLPDCADLLPGRSDIPALWTFPTCLAYVAELRQELVASSRSDANSDSSSDEDSDTDDDDAAPTVSRERRLHDHDLRCDARLFLKSRQNLNEGA
eukprot:TRINITY_DN20729_c1_g2_i1.p1 TRINITY_DN20729_c1_g2~~TRINITY_DN20729_c1_g2_i1.p1  ORF type:complete len:235 (+),score=22.25 TRINITY_DN20729_c1_g2_i1:48-707(+)